VPSLTDKIIISPARNTAALCIDRLLPIIIRLVVVFVWRSSGFRGSTN